MDVADAWLEDLDGRRLSDLTQRSRFRLRVVLKVRRTLPAPSLAFELLNVDGVTVLGFGKTLADEDETPRPLLAGSLVKLSAEFDVQLVPGRYSILCSMSRSRARGDDALRDTRLVDFLVKGSDPMPGMVFVAASVDASVGSTR